MRAFQQHWHLLEACLPTLVQNVFCGADPPSVIYPLMEMQAGEKFTCGGMDLWRDKVSTVFTFLEGQTELTQIFAQTVGIVGRVTLFARYGKKFFPGFSTALTCTANFHNSC